MIDFTFYKESGEWRLTISEGDTKLSTICFSEDVSYQEIVSFVPTIVKGDISTVHINFTDKK